MISKTFKAVKKPIEVEVFQFTKEMLPKIDKKRFEPAGENDVIGKTIRYVVQRKNNIRFYVFEDIIICYIKTLEGEVEFKVGDYIIKGVRGEYYPIKRDIFEETYKVVNYHH